MITAREGQFKEKIIKKGAEFIRLVRQRESSQLCWDRNENDLRKIRETDEKATAKSWQKS